MTTDVDDLLEFGLNESFEDSVAEHDADYDAFAGVRSFSDPSTHIAQLVQTTTVYRVYLIDDSGNRLSPEVETESEALAYSALYTCRDLSPGETFLLTRETIERREMVEEVSTVVVPEEGE